jgi:hypothetical protein
MIKVGVSIVLSSKTHTVDTVITLAKFDEIRKFATNINENGFFVCMDKGILSYVRDMEIDSKKNIAWISPHGIKQILFNKSE